MSKTESLKKTWSNLWATAKWVLFVFVSVKIIIKLGNDGRFEDGWAINLGLTLLALLLFVPGLYGRKPNKDGKPGFLASFWTRIFLASLILWLPIMGLGGAIDHRYKAYVAYQKLSPAEKLEFDLAEQKREQEEAMARKIAARDAAMRNNEAARIAEIASTSSREPVQRSTSYSGCVNEGVSYYREIGSYPTLSTGERAVDAASSRCRNFTGAFD